MRRTLGFSGVGVTATVIVLAMATGCSSAQSSENSPDEALTEAQGPVGVSEMMNASEGPPVLEAEAPPEPVAPRVPSGTRLSLRMVQSLSTESNGIGDPFQATLMSDLTSVDGDVLVAAGSLTQGLVTAARESQSAEDPAVLQLQIESVEVNGRTVPLRATLVEAEIERGTRDSGGETAAKIGVGTAAGALVGGLIGGDRRGTLIGAGAGAVAGTAVAVTTNDGHASIDEGATLTVVLDEPLEVW